MERSRPHASEVAKTVALVGLGVTALGFLATFGFSDQIKQQAKDRQHGLCPLCGKPLGRACEGHHRIPASLGGSNTNPLNCIELHSQRNSTDCHEVADRLALRKGMMVTDEGTFIPFAEAPVSLFKNEQVRKRTLQRFNPGEVIEGVIEFVAGKISHRKEKHRSRQHRKGYRGQGGRRR